MELPIIGIYGRYTKSFMGVCKLECHPLHKIDPL